MKGQVAIENLMTYGWMLLAVALVSGSLMGFGLGSTCSNSVSGFGIHQLKVVDFGYSSGDLKLLLENDDTEGYRHEIWNMNVSDPETGKRVVVSPKLGIENGQDVIHVLDGFTTSEACNTLEISMRYDRGKVLEEQVVTGMISTDLRITETDVNLTQPAYFDAEITSSESTINRSKGENSFEVNYTVTNTGDETQTQTVKVFFEGGKIQERTFELGPDSEKALNFSYDTSDLSTGSYQYRIQTEDEEINRAIQIVGPSTEPAEILIEDSGGNTFTEETEVRLYSSGNLLKSRSVTSGSTDFSLTPGSYTVVASRKNYWKANESFTVQESSITETLTMLKKPEVENLTLTDDSTCNEWDCWEYRGIIDWNITDPNNNLQQITITVNGNTEHTATDPEGSYTHQAWTGSGTEYRFRMEASYTNTTLCRSVRDIEDGENPSQDAYRRCGPYFNAEIERLNRYLEQGEGLHVDYTVENDGTAMGSQEIDLDFSGDQRDSSSHTLIPGEKEGGTLNHVPSGTGDFETSITSSNTSVSRQVFVEDNSGLIVTNMSSPDTGFLNGSIDPSATVIGNGSALSRTAELRIGENLAEGNYETLETKEIQIESGSKKIEFADLLLNESILTTGAKQIGIVYAGGIAINPITLRQKPKINRFNVTDDSTCGGWSCWEYRGIIDWNITDPNNNLQQINITVNGNVVHTSTSLTGSYTHQAWTGSGTEYEIVIEAIYPDKTLCRSVTDIEDGDSPPESAYSTC